MDVYLSSFTPMRHTLSGRARRSTLKMVVDQVSQRVVGAHMVGEDAPEIMQGLAIAMVMGLVQLGVVVLVLSGRALAYRGPAGGGKG